MLLVRVANNCELGAWGQALGVLSQLRVKPSARLVRLRTVRRRNTRCVRCERRWHGSPLPLRGRSSHSSEQHETASRQPGGQRMGAWVGAVRLEAHASRIALWASASASLECGRVRQRDASQHSHSLGTRAAPAVTVDTAVRESSEGEPGCPCVQPREAWAGQAVSALDRVRGVSSSTRMRTVRAWSAS